MGDGSVLEPLGHVPEIRRQVGQYAGHVEDKLLLDVVRVTAAEAGPADKLAGLAADQASCNAVSGREKFCWALWLAQPPACRSDLWQPFGPAFPLLLPVEGGCDWLQVAQNHRVAAAGQKQ